MGPLESHPQPHGPPDGDGGAAPAPRSSPASRTPEIAASPSVPSEAVPSEVAPAIDGASGEPSPALQPSRRRRRRSTRPEGDSVESTQGINGATEASANSEKTPARQVSFAHPSEVEFARILDFYGVRWLYEPRSFPLRWVGTRAVELFTPDFYLPGPRSLAGAHHAEAEPGNRQEPEDAPDPGAVP